MMRNLQQEQAHSIRLLLLCPDGALRQEMSDYFRQNEQAQIRLVETTAFLEEARQLIQQSFPDVLLLVDINQPTGWITDALQLCRELQRHPHGVATLVLTSTLQLDTTYVRNAMAAGAQNVLEAERAGAGKAAFLFRELAGAIRHSYQTVVDRRSNSPRPRPESASQLIALFSGRGGDGKSVIATALAATIARRQPQKKVVIVDFAVQFGAVAPMLGLHQPERTLVHLVNGKALDPLLNLATYLPKRDVGPVSTLAVVAAPATPAELHALTPADATALLTALRRSFDYVIVDLPAQITDAVIVTLQNSDHLLLPCLPELLSIRATRQVLKLFQSDAYLIAPAAQVHIVLNKVAKAQTIKVNDMEKLFGDQILARLPFDPGFIDDHINRGQPIGLLPASKRYGVSFLQELNRLCEGLAITPLQASSHTATNSKAPVSPAAYPRWRKLLSGA